MTGDCGEAAAVPSREARPWTPSSDGHGAGAVLRKWLRVDPESAVRSNNQPTNIALFLIWSLAIMKVTSGLCLNLFCVA